jgi:hypothetical protein
MERIGDGVQRELARAGGGSELAVTEITACWPAVVGEAVARQAWPLRIARDGTLHVATSSATWAFELDRLGPEIVARLRAEVGPSAPSKLRFAPGPLPETGAREAPREVEPPSPEVVAEAAAAASAVSDPELRELVARAARASLQKARSDRDF